MTRDDVLAMANEAGITFIPKFKAAIVTAEWLERFAGLVAAKERARCADIALRTVCDVHTPTGIKIYGTRAAKAILEATNAHP